MNTYQYLFKSAFLLCTTALLMGCSDQDEQMCEEQQVPLEISIKGCETREVITGTTLPEGSNLGVYVVNENDVATHSNIETLCFSSYCELGKTIYLTSSPQKVYAYYPYDKNAKLNQLSIDVNSQNDYLYGCAVDADNQPATVNATNPKANILLKHAMSRLTLNIKKSATNTKDGDIYSIYLPWIPLTGKLDIRSGEMTIEDASYGKLTIAAKFPLTTEGKLTDILILPMGKSEFELHLNISDKDYFVMVPITLWEAGQQYTFTIEVDDSSLKITEATITPWNNNEQSGINVGDSNYVE